MLYNIIFTKQYTKKATKFFQLHPQLVAQYEKVLHLLEINPFHPSLRLHPLQGSLKGYFSVSINMSYRISIEFIIEENTIIPLNIGDHDNVY